MCGINGIVNFNGDPVERNQIKRMNELLRHRGPDDEGDFYHRSVGFGHTRLSIIDLSPNGHQPFISDDQQLVMVYNGEIYNYIELKEELSKKGSIFRTHTDTEVLLKAYQFWGVDCLKRLNGMFAFAIYNTHTGDIFLARDFFGIKPLYYHLSERRFVFSSEIKPILSLFDTNEYNEKRVYEFISKGLIDQSDETCFKSIKQIPQSHHALLSTRGEPDFKLHRYWDLSRQSKEDYSEDEFIHGFREKFFRSVNIQLRSDVLVGTLLSGGLDSSALVGVINETNPGLEHHTVSAIYDDSYYDESGYINAVLEHIPSLKSHFVKPKAETLHDTLPDLIRCIEEPFMSTSYFAYWEVIRLAKENNLTVLLFGQGADELLLGYRKFLFFYLKHLFNKRATIPFLRQFITLLFSPSVWYTTNFRSGVRYLSQKFNPLSQLIHPHLHQIYGESDNILVSGDFYERNKADLYSLSVPELLHYGDRISMAHSVELRVPFLDHELADFIFNAPIEMKIRGTTTKYIMRRALQDILPQKIYQRKTKLGFSTPQESWFRNYLLEDLLDTLRKAEFIPKFVMMDKVIAKLKHFAENRWSFLGNESFFRFYILEKWARIFSLR